MKMNIVADENIPYVREAFSELGDVVFLPGREIVAEQVRDADLLLVRSVTRVNESLLKGSRVRFVGSATIGLDHVDEDWLRARGITLAYAPGSNANAVAEYVVTALVALGEDCYAGRTLGIIGLGRIGSLVRRKALALGLTVLANDPPLERAGRPGLIASEELLERSDLVSCHVPLTNDGPDATRHLLDASRLAELRPHAIVINTARGAVIDNAALLNALRGRRLGGAVLDVWENEPEPDPELVRLVTLATPHIAGYSWDGKVAGTKMLYEAACAYLRRPARWAPPLPDDLTEPLTIEQTKTGQAVEGVVLRAYDIRRDDAAFRATMMAAAGARGRTFDRLRASYPTRLEFAHTRIAVPHGRPELRATLQGLGFQV